MRSLVFKLLALIAYMAMPFTMSVAMSAPPPAATHHEAMMGMEGLQHCPEQTAPGIDHTAFIGCGMMCAALPAADFAEPEPLSLDAAAPAVSRVRSFIGIHLDIATPPPRRA